ncbi:MAG: SDR family oxidoreductase [Corynebacterium sp.]|nr:SDR family oxidoreductase [Corynebacterium sp.]
MQSIFISGGAAGIGRAVANKFANAGWLVGSYDIAKQDHTHPNIICGELDVRDAESWDAALSNFCERTDGQLDVLDNNAGIIRAGELSTLNPSDIEAQISINTLGPTLGARAAFPYLKRTPGAQLVSMASAAAIFGQPEICIYGASKSYVGSLTEALSLEWRHDDIRVVDIWPLWAKTALADNSATSIKRLGVHITPEQVAQRVWDATHPKNRWQRGRIHYGVSVVDETFYRMRSASPDRLARAATRLFSAK